MHYALCRDDDTACWHAASSLKGELCIQNIRQGEPDYTMIYAYKTENMK